MTGTALPVGHEDIGKPGSSPHIDVTDNQPLPIELTESPGQRLQALLDQLHHSGNLDLQAQLAALKTAVSGLLAHHIATLSHGQGEQD